MPNSSSIFEEFSEPELEKIRSCAKIKSYSNGDLVFAAGDQADSLYIIESGKVSIKIDKSGREEEICVLGPGEYFGEMAIFNDSARSASVVAIEDSTLLSIDKDDFFICATSQPAVTEKIKKELAKRNEELFLREKLVDTTGIKGSRLHVTIKGDPSLRFSAFTRERYESVIDNILPRLEPNLEELLLNRSVYQLYIGLNNGEIRTSSVFDPFVEEIHTANNMIESAYVDRHFPKISYEEKSKLIKEMYRFISGNANFNRLPEHWKFLYSQTHDEWRPVAREEIASALKKIIDLRNIEDFYLRNFVVNMMHDAIRMQFNCDGTHIVSSEDYDQFWETYCKTEA